MNQHTYSYPIWEINFGLCWKATFTLKCLREKGVYKNNSTDKNDHATMIFRLQEGELAPF